MADHPSTLMAVAVWRVLQQRHPTGWWRIRYGDMGKTQCVGCGADVSDLRGQDHLPKCPAYRVDIARELLSL